MYKMINLISALIRQFVLPNPYVSFIDNEVYAELFNIFVGGTILHFLSFFLTGFCYTRGVDHPASGSFWYLLSYIYMTFVITIIGCFISNIWLAIIVLVVVYILSIIVVNRLFNQRFTY